MYLKRNSPRVEISLRGEFLPHLGVTCLLDLELKSAWITLLKLGIRYTYSFTPGLSSPLFLVKLIFLYTCSTELKSGPLPLFRPCLEATGETHLGGNSA